MRLVDEWKQAWKWLSMHMLTLLAAAPLVYENVESVKDYIPANYYHYAVTILAILAMVGRVVKQ